jgi:hypothetical protein
MVARNHHNPSLNAEVTNLSKFFQNRQSYSTEHMANFLHVPHRTTPRLARNITDTSAAITWLTPKTLDNYEDDDIFLESDASLLGGSHHVTAQQAATHGLEALSAAAADYTSHKAPLYPGHYISNASNSTMNAIDPNLDAKTALTNAIEQYGEPDPAPPPTDPVDQQLVQALRQHAQQAERVKVDDSDRRS